MVAPAVHTWWHWPAKHTAMLLPAEGQTLPQAPQFCTLVVVSAQ